MKRILVIGPHCDDAELGCGGYMARSAEEGATVKVWIAATGSIYFAHIDRVVPEEERLEETRLALQMVGAEIHSIGFSGHDTRLDQVPMVEGICKLDAVFEDYQPDEVFIPLPSFHQDHVWTYEVAIAATRPNSNGIQPSLIAAYEYPLQKWGKGACADPSNGGLYVDISKYIDIKLQSLACHATQMRQGENSLSLQSVRALAKMRGFESAFDYAELFHTLRRRVPDKHPIE